MWSFSSFLKKCPIGFGQRSIQIFCGGRITETEIDETAPTQRRKLAAALSALRLHLIELLAVTAIITILAAIPPYRPQPEFYCSNRSP